jgi:hypothetical protein
MTKVEQVSIDGDVLLVDSADVVRDRDGKVIAVSPKGHGKGSEGDYSDNDAILIAAAEEAEAERWRVSLEETESNIRAEEAEADRQRIRLAAIEHNTEEGRARFDAALIADAERAEAERQRVLLEETESKIRAEEAEADRERIRLAAIERNAERS